MNEIKPWQVKAISGLLAVGLVSVWLFLSWLVTPGS
jgi:hypothetical protein